jgi:hypothetical protein
LELEALITKWKERGASDAGIAQALQNQLDLIRPDEGPHGHDASRLDSLSFALPHWKANASHDGASDCVAGTMQTTELQRQPQAGQRLDHANRLDSPICLARYSVSHTHIAIAT